ncbi:leucine-rich repeat transmembrane neuronal protein 4-like [Ochlerotatus camptorhynchus]|uniref:leucine-rich repeat transmembrane neuronal protein 4-like n=1 Tax=Ochlerotatus camptorhynchus TaxID=644619 RepID=UPI0031E11153
MKVLLLAGILVICFTPIVFSQNDLLTEFDKCRQNITSIDQSSDVLKYISAEILYLSLCDNDLLSIHKHSFQKFSLLEKLVLDRNSHLNFNSDGSEFLESESLTDLHCFRCGVDKIYNKSLQGMPRLEQINLTDNRIEQIEAKAFYGNKNLERIDLRFNKLRRLPSEMLTPLDSIRWIDLSSNTELAPEGSEPFLISTVLEKLRCNECGFVIVQEYTFSMLPGLKELFLRKNKIYKIHSMAFPQSALTKLMLEDNALKSIDQSILNVMNLTICLDNNSNEMECFLKDLSEQKKFFCSTTTQEDVECLPPTTIKISTTSTIDVTSSTTDMTIISTNDRMPITTTNHPDTFAKSENLITSTSFAPSLEIVEGISDAYIGGYLTLIFLAQIVTFVLLFGVLLKLKKYDTDPDVDRYAENILNPNPIYIAVY